MICVLLLTSHLFYLLLNFAGGDTSTENLSVRNNVQNDVGLFLSWGRWFTKASGKPEIMLSHIPYILSSSTHHLWYTFVGRKEVWRVSTSTGARRARRISTGADAVASTSYSVREHELPGRSGINVSTSTNVSSWQGSDNSQVIHYVRLICVHWANWTMGFWLELGFQFPGRPVFFPLHTATGIWNSGQIFYLKFVTECEKWLE